ncbi:MAG: hypothetical protein QF742_13075, partial [Alphaproteobacteria bacterium]|nr:hypothetical protein [Alphaproteobacteria bacterium]
MQDLSTMAGNVFSGVPLDRVDHRRGDAAWIEARLHDPASRFVAVWNQQSIVLGGAEPRAALNERRTLDGLLDGGTPLVFLGVTAGDSGIAHFAADFSAVPEQ